MTQALRINRCAASHPALKLLDSAIIGAEFAPEWVGQWWLARDSQGTPVGYAGARYWAPDRSVFLSRAGVLPGARGNGLQRRFIRVRERWAREQGAVGCYTYVAPWNTHSANNLIRAGYEIWRPSREWGLAGSIYFWRALR